MAFAVCDSLTALTRSVRSGQTIFVEPRVFSFIKRDYSVRYHPTVSGFIFIDHSQAHDDALFYEQGFYRRIKKYFWNPAEGFDIENRKQQPNGNPVSAPVGAKTRFFDDSGLVSLRLKIFQTFCQVNVFF